MLVDFLVDCWFSLLSAWLVFLGLRGYHFGHAECPESLVLLRYHRSGYNSLFLS
ncbi:hypothetical protein DL95DRAFT_398327 [Leptodontidium sp. 2 PMI_412]|nr:hypothetical protein DL95DRAFT_398327 [Leptodontidium sp. 2 PMI_412]